jgi:hypothetical protein
MMGKDTHPNYLTDGWLHRVAISRSLEMGKYEVTQAQWRAALGSNPSFNKGDTLPVENISWDEAQQFIERLNFAADGFKYRLPTEAELCAEYNVSRITVRQALSELMKDGLIYRDRGRGTFVTEDAEFKRPELKGSIENLIVAAKGTHTRVLSYQEIVPSPAIARFSS